MNYAFWRRRYQFALLGLALTLGLSACVGLDTTPSALPTISINSNPGGLSPTPTAPPYTVGASVNNNTFTSTSGTLDVYVIFHHGQLAQAGGKVSLFFHYNEDGGGIPGLNNQAGTRTTGSDGFAVFSIGFSGLPTDTPISIDVAVRFSGANYVAKNAAAFSVVNVTPSVTPSPPGNGG
jgi:hypothetical protein